jgi:hypothetical protein
MKRNIETTIDPNIEPGMAIAEVYLPGQSQPFVISGMAEAVITAAQTGASHETGQCSSCSRKASCTAWRDV